MLIILSVGTYRCAVKVSPFQLILGTKIIDLGSLLVTFGDFWAPFWAPGEGAGPLWETFGDGVEF